MSDQVTSRYIEVFRGAPRLAKIVIVPTEQWTCQECGRRFKTVKAAEKAASVGCPKCGGCDIDLVSERAVPALPDTKR